MREREDGSEEGPFNTVGIFIFFVVVCFLCHPRAVMVMVRLLMIIVSLLFYYWAPFIESVQACLVMESE